jgi:hypothetical protein
MIGASSRRSSPRRAAKLIVAYAGYMQHSGVRTGIIETGPPPYPVR